MKFDFFQPGRNKKNKKKVSSLELGISEMEEYKEMKSFFEDEECKSFVALVLESNISNLDWEKRKELSEKLSSDYYDIKNKNPSFLDILYSSFMGGPSRLTAFLEVIQEEQKEMEEKEKEHFSGESFEKWYCRIEDFLLRFKKKFEQLEQKYNLKNINEILEQKKIELVNLLGLKK